MDVDLNPDGPHSPERTAEVGDLFDQCSRFLTYATMAEKHGLECPADASRLVGEIYSATSRFQQMFAQLEQFLRAQKASRRLYEARGGDVSTLIEAAALDLREAAMHSRDLTRLLRAAQTDISGLGVDESPAEEDPDAT